MRHGGRFSGLTSQQTMRTGGGPDSNESGPLAVVPGPPRTPGHTVVVSDAEILRTGDGQRSDRTLWARARRWRRPICAAVIAASAVLAGGRGDWDLFVDAGRDLMSDDIGLGVFVANREVQTGPVTLALTWALSWLPRHGFGVGVALVMVLGWWSVRAVARASASRWVDSFAHEQCVTAGGVVVLALWGQLAGYGHLDDAIVLAIAVRCVIAVDRPMVRGVLVGLAVGVKPWAVVLTPLVFDWPVPWAIVEGRMRRLVEWARPGAIAAAIGALCWLPFVIHSPDTSDSLKPSVSLADDSVLLLLGLRTADVPAVVRLAQLVGALAVATWCCVRGRREAALMAALAVRMATDLGTWSYYTPGLLLATLAFDLLRRRRAVPMLTLATFVLLPLPWIVDSPDVRAAMRLAACVLVIGVAVSGRVPSADPSCPSSGPSADG